MSDLIIAFHVREVPSRRQWRGKLVPSGWSRREIGDNESWPWAELNCRLMSGRAVTWQQIEGKAEFRQRRGSCPVFQDCPSHPPGQLQQGVREWTWAGTAGCSRSPYPENNNKMTKMIRAYFMPDCVLIPLCMKSFNFHKKAMRGLLL